MTGASAMPMFAALLDRSVARIGESAADGRRFDRQAIAEIADVWDNNTFPLFSTALSRPAWRVIEHSRGLARRSAMALQYNERIPSDLSVRRRPPRRRGRAPAL